MILQLPPTLFLLGVDDPEMRAMEHLLKEDQREYRFATVTGKRVHPGNAYKADPVDLTGYEQLVCVECSPRALPSDITMVRIDHHRPGDPGYGLPPAQYWQASSLGQLVNFLGLEMELGSREHLVLAAMDHAPAAAIRGECPGVSAKDVLDRKFAEIAAATEYPVAAVRDRIAQMHEVISASPILRIGNADLIDTRALDLGTGYSLDLLSMQTAALAGGQSVLLKHRDREGGPEKWSISGHASPTLIEAFMREWAPLHGLAGIYGVPNRGYAGGYVSPFERE